MILKIIAFIGLMEIQKGKNIKLKEQIKDKFNQKIEI